MDKAIIKCILILFCMSSCSKKISTIQTDRVYQTTEYGFSQAVASNELIFGSGQVGWNTKNELSSIQFSGQFKQIISNISSILEAAKSDWNHMLVLRFYVIELDQDKRSIISSFLQSKYVNDYSPATTVIGIQQLARQDLLVEIEFIAKKR